jgi:transposase
MIERDHGIDRHTSFSTISVLNRQGKEVRFGGAFRDFNTSVGDPRPADAVVREASTGSFWWEDQLDAWKTDPEAGFPPRCALLPP